MKARTIYYAHSIKIYGSQRELRELTFLRSRFPKANVICPNNDLGQLGSLKDYLNIVDGCLILVASEYNNHIGKGVYHEVARAISNQVQVFVIREKESVFSLKEVTGIKIKNRSDIAVKYGKLIVLKSASW